MNIKFEKTPGFKEEYLNDDFFQSLKDDYEEFSEWYLKSCGDRNKVGYYWTKDGKVVGFIGIKVEDEEIVAGKNEIAKKAKRLKITTIKAASDLIGFSEFVIFHTIHGAIKKGIDEIYFSVIPDTPEKVKLMEIFETYGFAKIGSSKFSINGKHERKNDEIYLLKNVNKKLSGDFKLDYPKYEISDSRIMVINENFHDNYLPSAKLKNVEQKFEATKMGIKKAYVHSNRSWKKAKEGDLILIYRRSEKQAKFKSVITSVAKHVKTLEKGKEYNTFEEFKNILRNNHAFSEDDLKEWFEHEKFITIFIYLESFGEGKNRYNWDRLNKENIIVGNPNFYYVSEDDTKTIINESKK